MAELTFGQVAKQAGIGVETVRFYERKGLIAEPARRASGYRAYEQDAVARLWFIRQAKDLGFSLKEIGELLELRVNPGSTCADVRGRAREKIRDIDDRIERLREMRAGLERLARTCRGRGPVADCPILDAIEKERQS